MSQPAEKSKRVAEQISLFLCGDVMTGRGLDQVLPYPSKPQLYEPYARHAGSYVKIAEEAYGPIPKPVDFAYIWGDALEELERMAPDVRIINLETSVTTSNTPWPAKGIHYRMHPKNIPCITVAGIDCCVLANNHVLDWGYEGLEETLDTLRDASLKVAGAGDNQQQARAPAVMEVTDKGRVIVFSFGSESSGIPREWAAGPDKPGLNLLPDVSRKTVEKIAKDVESVKQARDIVVASIHWGENWGYETPDNHIQFAHNLIDSAGVDIIHGHSSHHPKGIEVYKDKLILYGCGDFLNDYEGISGYEWYRDDLALMYFVDISPATGKLIRLDMIPTQIRRFQSNRASEEDTLWLKEVLNREGKKFNTQVKLSKEMSLLLNW